MSDPRLDAEIKLRTVAGFGIGLVVILLAVTALMWWLSIGLRDHLASDDPSPAALPEARIQEPPAGPLLQADPIGEMAAMRAEEDAILEATTWADEAAGTVSLPIADALEIVAANGGFPTSSPAPEEAPAQDATAQDATEDR